MPVSLLYKFTVSIDSHGSSTTSLHCPTQYWSTTVQPLEVFSHSMDSGCRVQSVAEMLTFQSISASVPVATHS